MAEKNITNSAVGNEHTEEAIPAQDPLVQTRLKRAYRHIAAQRLVSLTDQLAPEHASDVMNAIDPQSLDSLPHWCLLDDASLLELQRICGAVFIAPVLHRCIDGPLLSSWCSLLGTSLFEDALAVAGEIKLQVSPFLPEASESLTLLNGATVLLSTIDGHPASLLLQKRFAEYPTLIPAQTALTVYTLASSLHQRIAEAHHFAQSSLEESELPATIPLETGAAE